MFQPRVSYERVSIYQKRDEWDGCWKCSKIGKMKMFYCIETTSWGIISILPATVKRLNVNLVISEIIDEAKRQVVPPSTEYSLNIHRRVIYKTYSNVQSRQYHFNPLCEHSLAATINRLHSPAYSRLTLSIGHCLCSNEPKNVLDVSSIFFSYDFVSYYRSHFLSICRLPFLFSTTKL